MPKLLARNVRPHLKERGFETGAADWLEMLSEAHRMHALALSDVAQQMNQMTAILNSFSQVLTGMDVKLKELDFKKKYDDDGDGGVLVS